MTIQLLILHNLLHKCLNATEQNYQPDWEELSALRWFVYQSDQGEAERLELLKQAGELGIEPSELLALRWLANLLIDHKL
jgi:hypothetical protein